MAQLTKFAEETMLDHMFNGATTVYVMLATNGAGTISGNTPLISDFTEVDDANYLRQSVSFGAAFQENGKGTVKNDIQVDFPTWAVAEDLPINYAVLVDVSSGTTGNVLGYYQLSTALQPDAGQPVRIAVNGLVVTCG